MSENEGAKVVKGWTDKERLVYLLALLDAGGKIDFNGPRPEGRSKIACERMLTRLRATVKDELAALKAGLPFSTGEGNGSKATPKKNDDGEDAPKTPKSTAGRKRKAKTDGDGDCSPKKRGRPKKAAPVQEEVAEEADTLGVKAEPEVDEDLNMEV